MTQKVYLDTCRWNRPLDDQSQARVRRETEAVEIILDRLRDGPDGRWVRGEALDFEVGQCCNADTRERLQSLMNSVPAGEHVPAAGLQSRAHELTALGFRSFDALHLAGADVLLTVDDPFQRRAARHADVLRVSVQSPVAWLTAQGEGD